ncbi:MAG TPA: hypothetical protein VNE42_09365 [Acidimicrobiales bacterium]|nr:hypothetical protein [Acidimicrobiales bacterium]
MSIGSIRSKIAEIDAHTERVAINQPSGSDAETLAYAVHNICMALRDIADELERLGKSR